MKKIISNISIIGISIAPYVNAASIYSIAPHTIALVGPITQGDFNKIRQLTYDIPAGQGILILNSQGGVAYEGISIGEYVRSSGISTAVLPNDECYSSCAIIWAAGKDKYASLPNSIIGFHAIYDGYTREQSGFANAKLGAVLGRWGYTDSAIEFMTFAKPSQFNYLTYNTAYKYNIQYTDIESLINSKPVTRNNNTQYTQTPYDVVNGFYQALSIADGDLAAAYVIPEKRGVGPFNQTNIYHFYSSLRIPLKVQNIIQVNHDKFEVNYTYTATKTQCNGKATITLENHNGYYLIKSIKANC